MSLIRKCSVETWRCSEVIIKNMHRYARNVIAALLTFTIGVVVATSSHRIFPMLTQLFQSHSSTERAECEEWKKAASVSNGLGWDLTYMSLLKNAGVCPGEVYCEFAAARPQPPVDKYFAEWQREPFISSILIELPDGHADMQALWLIRTKEQAYWSWYHPERQTQMDLHPLPTKDYDSAFEAIACWKPYEPSSRRFFRGPEEGYIGFLSLYKEGKSRQMLLTSRDMYDPFPKGSETPDEATWGRLFKTLKPVYLDIREHFAKTDSE